MMAVTSVHVDRTETWPVLRRPVSHVSNLESYTFKNLNLTRRLNGRKEVKLRSPIKHLDFLSAWKHKKHISL